MRELPKTELSLSIRADGVDLHCQNDVGDTAKRVLRALALGGHGGAVPLPDPNPPVDEEALARAMWDAFSADDSMLGAVRFLRSRGLLRTPEDARLVADLRAQLDECRAACRKADALEEQLASLEEEHERTKERCVKAQYNSENFQAAYERARVTLAEKEAEWNAWAEKAQADIDAANKELTELRKRGHEDGAALVRLQQDLELTQAQYERERDARQAAQKEAQDLRTLLAEEQKTMASLSEAKEFYERDRAAWHQKALELEAKAAANHAKVVP